MTRVAVAAMLVLVAVCGGCDGRRSNHFEVWQDGELLRYDKTTVRSKVDGSQLVLTAWNSRDPDRRVADDDSSDRLLVVFDWDALLGIATDEDYPVSGEGYWSDVTWMVSADDVTFVGDEEHTMAVEKVLFSHWCFGCVEPDDTGAQAVRGSLRLTRNQVDRFAGVIELRIEGEVPGTWNRDRCYDLVLEFDQRPQNAGADAGTDAGADTGADAGTDLG